jgi:hypothetical protein
VICGVSLPGRVCGDSKADTVRVGNSNDVL